MASFELQSALSVGILGSSKATRMRPAAVRSKTDYARVCCTFPAFFPGLETIAVRWPYALAACGCLGDADLEVEQCTALHFTELNQLFRQRCVLFRKT